MVMSVDTILSSGRWETNLKGILVLSDIAILKGRKEKAAAPAVKMGYVPPQTKEQLDQKIKDAEQQKTDAVKGTPTSKPPFVPCIPKGQEC